MLLKLVSHLPGTNELMHVVQYVRCCSQPKHPEITLTTPTFIGHSGTYISKNRFHGTTYYISRPYLGLLSTLEGQQHIGVFRNILAAIRHYSGHNERNGVSNHRRLDCFLNHLFGWKQSSASISFERRIYRWLMDSPHKGPVPQKMFPFDGVIMPLGIRWWHIIHAPLPDS